MNTDVPLETFPFTHIDFTDAKQINDFWAQKHSDVFDSDLLLHKQ